MDEIEDYLANNYPNLLDEYIEISTNLNRVSLAFLIAHEYSHHLLGHTNIVLKNVPKNYHTLEIEADKSAYLLLIQTMYSDGEIPLDCFLGIMCLYLATSLLQLDPKSASKNHPSTFHRLEKFIEYFNTLDCDSHGRQTVYNEFFSVCEILSKHGKWSDKSDWWEDLIH